MNLDSQRTLFSLLGIPWQLTPTAWLFLPSRLGLGLVVAFVFLGSLGINARLAYGVGFALMTVFSQFVHIVGHTLGAQRAGAPMAANLIQSTKILTFYPNDPVDLPDRVHLLRALGGPVGAPPLLLLPGAAVSATMWHPNVAALSQAYRVYALDILGDMGKSVSTQRLAQPADFGAWLIEVLDGLQIAAADVAGLLNALPGYHAGEWGLPAAAAVVVTHWGVGH